MRFCEMYARRCNGTIVDFSIPPYDSRCGSVSDYAPMRAAIIEDGDQVVYQLWTGAIQDDEGMSHGGRFETRTATASVTTSKSFVTVTARDAAGNPMQILPEFYGISGYPVYNVQPLGGSCGYDPSTPTGI
jgi:hypothetical protein